MSFPPFMLPRPRFPALTMLSLLIAALGAMPAHADNAADIARLAQSGKGDEALKRIDAILSRQPADAQMRFMKGVILSETRPADAVAIFTRLTQDYPKLPEPYNNLAVLYAAAGQYEKARAALDKALRTSPAYATAFENLGDVHARLASQAYDKALQVEPAAVGAPVPAARLALVRSLGVPVGQAPAVAVAPLPPPKAAEPAPVVVAAIKPAEPVEEPKARPAPLPDAVKPTLAEAPKTARPAPAAQPDPKLPPARAELAKAEPAKAAPAVQPDPKLPPARTELAKAEPAKAASAPVDPRSVRLVKADKPDPKARAAQEAAAEKESVLNAVESWAKAWSAQDVSAYLAHYASDFNPPGSQTRKAWMEERQARIAGKGRIKVSVDAPQISTEGNTATVRFRQNYVSDRLSAKSRKTLELERQRGKWLIKQERSS
jgi:Flp pilus assembly protein TadD/ketosteroid isomerase-like protein